MYIGNADIKRVKPQATLLTTSYFQPVFTGKSTSRMEDIFIHRVAPPSIGSRTIFLLLRLDSGFISELVHTSRRKFMANSKIKNEILFYGCYVCYFIKFKFFIAYKLEGKIYLKV